MILRICQQGHLVLSPTEGLPMLTEGHPRATEGSPFWGFLYPQWAACCYNRDILYLQRASYNHREPPMPAGGGGARLPALSA